MYHRDSAYSTFTDSKSPASFHHSDVSPLSDSPDHDGNYPLSPSSTCSVSPVDTIPPTSIHSVPAHYRNSAFATLSHGQRDSTFSTLTPAQRSSAFSRNSLCPPPSAPFARNPNRISLPPTNLDPTTLITKRISTLPPPPLPAVSSDDNKPKRKSFLALAKIEAKPAGAAGKPRKTKVKEVWGCCYCAAEKRWGIKTEMCGSCTHARCGRCGVVEEVREVKGRWSGFLRR